MSVVSHDSDQARGTTGSGRQPDKRVLPELQEEYLRSMEITRRQFNRLLVSAAILCAVGLRWIATRPATTRVMKALKPLAFPGRLHPLDSGDVKSPGKWSG